ncbi:hypothetical protein EG329_014470 [Mollisiaceae sp. DMI_Dod_QoI]|nr:hypothetical protein EG329_014470 [Helotiales sp. DMI_Dod_QoI]
MGSSLSRAFKRKNRKDEFSAEIKSPPAWLEAVETVPAPRPMSVDDDSFDNEISNVQPIQNYIIDDDSEEEEEVYHEAVYANDVYYDDEDMMRFVSALSLAEYNQTSLEAQPKKAHRLPDALEEFFQGLDAQVTGGPSNSGKIQASQVIEEVVVKEEEHILVDVSVGRECAICVEEKPLEDFPKITAACQHEEHTCLGCVQNWLAREVDNTDWDKIHCVACKEVVPYDDMKRLMTSAAFEKYDQYSRNFTLSNMPNFRWCIAPNCKSGQIHENGVDGPIFLCTACFSKACVIHNVAWHESETCAEYSYRQDPTVKQAEEAASATEIKESSKPCPGPNCR